MMKNLCKNYEEEFNSHQNNLDYTIKNVQAFISLAEIKSNSKILCVESNTEFLLNELIENNPLKIIYYDVQKNEDNFKNIKNRKIKELDCNFYDIKENDFNVALFYNCYQHFFNKVDFIRKLSSIMARYGRIMIAFDKGREKINMEVKSQNKNNMSQIFSVYKEAIIFSEFFKIDIAVDTSSFYILSGTKIFR